ncbi:MAG: pitrilysin family protein [Candidatus Omnitrophota bacterium]
MEPKSQFNSFEKYTLDNGITVILKPVDSAPVVALNVWVHVGSKDENEKTRGLAHIQEHMLFQGTSTYAPGEITGIVESAGGKFNAYTSLDTTVYHITMPKDSIETGVKILASMMSEAAIDSNLLSGELEVIMEEFRRSNDNPKSLLYKEFFKTAYSQHPYRHPIIGYEETIKNISREQVIGFYRKWYVPQNMTVVIAGNIDTEKTKDIVQRAFGPIKRKINPKKEILPEPRQKTLQVKIIRAPFDNTYLILGFPVTPFEHLDTPAIDILFTVLGSGRASRLVQILREEKKIVTDIECEPYTPEHAGVGFVDAELKPDNLKAALGEILAQVYRLCYEPVGEGELNKAKLLLEADFIYEKEDYANIARELGFFEVISSGAEAEDLYLKRIRQVTKEDIINVARQYLHPGNLNVTVLYPEDEQGLISEDEIADINNKSFESARSNAKTLETGSIQPAIEKKSSFNLKDKPVLAKENPAIISRNYDSKNNVTKVVYRNGMTLLVRRDKSVETFAVTAAYLGGLLVESRELNGISNFTSQMLARGTAGRNQAELAMDIERIAAIIYPFSGRNTFGIKGRCLSAYSKEFFEILSDILVNADFPQDQIEVVRNLTLDALNRQKDSPVKVAMDGFSALLYGGHSYGFNILGTEGSIGRIGRKELVEFSEKFMNPSNLVIAVAGDVNEDEVVSCISDYLGNLSLEKDDTMLAGTEPDFPVEARFNHIVRSTQQVNILYGFPGITVQDSNRYAFDVLNQVLSGFSGRFFTNLRDKESLAYAVSGVKVEGLRYPGFYAVYIGSAPDKTKAAIAGIERELKKVAEGGITDIELKEAADYLAGSFAVDLQTFSSQAELLALYELYGLGYDEYSRYIEGVRSVTRQDVQAVAGEYFTLDKHALVVVGPAGIDF